MWYAPEKEISLLVSLDMPRSTLLFVEGRANFTIPHIDTFLLNVKVDETLRNKYVLSLLGTWFNGHNISAKGIYFDRSSGVITNYDLKINLASFYFNNITLSMSLLIDPTNLRFCKLRKYSNYISN